MMIAGCQIHYAVKCNLCNTGSVNDEEIEGGHRLSYVRNSHIYDADEGDKETS